MATTAPGTRFAAISRAKKSSIRASPCCEKPTSSGFASGNGPALTAVKVTASSAALKRRFFTGASPTVRFSHAARRALFFARPYYGVAGEDGSNDFDARLFSGNCKVGIVGINGNAARDEAGGEQPTVQPHPLGEYDCRLLVGPILQEL